MPQLQIRHRQQQRTNLCWAACAEMLTNYYGVTMGQFAFANQGVASLEMENANTKGTAQDVGRLIQKLTPSIRMGWTTTQSIAMTFSEVKAKIDAGFPIIGFANKHAMLICGYEYVNGDKEAIRFHDPDKASGPGLTYYHTYAKDWVASAWVTSFSMTAGDQAMFGVD